MVAFIAAHRDEQSNWYGFVYMAFVIDVLRPRLWAGEHRALYKPTSRSMHWSKGSMRAATCRG